MDKIRSSIHSILRLLPGPLHDTRAVLAVGELRVYVPPEPALPVCTKLPVAQV